MSGDELVSEDALKLRERVENDDSKLFPDLQVLALIKEVRELRLRIKGLEGMNT